MQMKNTGPFLWSDFLASQEIWIFNPTWSKTNYTKSGFGTLHCTVQFICTQKLDLHAIQLWGGPAPAGCHQEPPGSGKQWGGVAPDQGVAGVTRLFRLLAKTQRVQATYSIPFHSMGGGIINVN